MSLDARDEKPFARREKQRQDVEVETDGSPSAVPVSWHVLPRTESQIPNFDSICSRHGFVSTLPETLGLAFGSRQVGRCQVLVSWGQRTRQELPHSACAAASAWRPPGPAAESAGEV